MDDNRRKTLHGCLTGAYLFASFGLVVFLVIWSSACSPQRAAQIAAPYGIRIPPHWKAVVLNFDEDSDRVVDAYNWPLGTRRDNPTGFRIAIVFVVAFIAAPPTILATIRWRSPEPDAVYWDHRTGKYVDPTDDPEFNRQLAVDPPAPTPDAPPHAE
jgi:hypothetical protein